MQIGTSRQRASGSKENMDKSSSLPLRPKRRSQPILPGLVTEEVLLAAVIALSRVNAQALSSATNILRRYGSLVAAINVPEDELAADPHIGAVGAANINALRRIIIQGSAAPLRATHFLPDISKLIHYLGWSTKRDGLERVRLLSLGPKNNLLCDEIIAEGDPGFVPVSKKQIAQHALNSGAYRIVLVHNHPSGNSEPSDEDIDLTEEVRLLCLQLSIHLADHLILGGHGWYSFTLRRVFEAKSSGF